MLLAILAAMIIVVLIRSVPKEITINDDNTAKVKLISGSLSKSYPFKIDEFEKPIVNNEQWVGFTTSKI